MKTTLSLICAFCLFVLNTFGQEENDLQLTKHHRHLQEVSGKLTAPNETNNPHNIKIGDSDVPISSYDGQIPTEEQLKTIQNALVDDFLVNEDITGIGQSLQQKPSIAMDGSGNFVIVWEDDRKYQNYHLDIYFQLFNSSGIKIGVNTKVNDDAGISNHNNPSISMDSHGNFVIAWIDERNNLIPDNPTNYDVYFQCYDSDGKALGVNKKVNDHTGIAGQYNPSISMDSQGNFVIAWTDERNNLNTTYPYNSDIYFQRYDSAGMAIGINTKANDDAGTKGQHNPSISTDSQGNFVIAWADERNRYSYDYNYDIYYQLYNSGGAPIGINTMVNDAAGKGNVYGLSVSMNPQGNFVIAWSDERNRSSYLYDYDIYYQLYEAGGIPIRINTMANDVAGTADVYGPSASMNSQGNFVIMWNGIYFQLYDSSGTAIGINTKVSSSWGSPTIAMDSQGNFVIASSVGRSVTSDIYFQQYDSSGTPIGINTKTNDDGFADQYSPAIAICSNGNFVIAWTDERNDLISDYYDYSDIYFQRYNSYGTPMGVNTKVNDDTVLTRHYSPSVAMDSQGNFIITWTDYRKGNSYVYFQRYDSSGTAIGINTNLDFGGDSPTIAMDGSGNFVIAWKISYYTSDIYFQRFNSSGAAIGIATKVHADTSLWIGHTQNAISMDSQGNFVIAWRVYLWEDPNPPSNFDTYSSNSDTYSSYPGIYYQRYDNVGITQGVNTKVNDNADAAYQYSPSIVMDGAGNFLIVWGDERNGNNDIYFQRYDSRGTAIGINTKANDRAKDQNSFSIAMDGTGNFVIVWTDYRDGLDDPDIIGQRYFANGTPNGNNYCIVANGPNYKASDPVIASIDKRIVFTWVDDRNNRYWDIYGKIVDWDWEGEIPVEMTLFEATALENTVQLDWVTATETNNLGFEIQKKVKDEFVKIAFVNGHGTTTQVSNYSLMDKDVTPGSYSYRLKQIDYDGTYEYSKIVEVNVGSPKVFSLSQNYPNPFNPTTSIEYRVASKEYVTLKVYDILGNEVATLVNEVKPAGSYQIDFKPTNLPSGVYFYQLKAGSFSETKKMLLLR